MDPVATVNRTNEKIQDTDKTFVRISKSAVKDFELFMKSVYFTGILVVFFSL